MIPKGTTHDSEDCLLGAGVVLSIMIICSAIAIIIINLIMLLKSKNSPYKIGLRLSLITIIAFGVLTSSPISEHFSYRASTSNFPIFNKIKH